MKNLLHITYIAILGYASISSGQATNTLSIEPAVAMKFLIESNKAYMVEQSDDLVTWTNASEWIIDNNGDTNTFYLEADNASRYFRYKSKNRPTVLETIPENGSTNVDANITEITIKFSDDMAGGGTWGSASTFGEYPEWGSFQRPDDRTLIRGIILETNTQYAFWLNPPSALIKGHQSIEGIPLMPSLVTFKTE